MLFRFVLLYYFLFKAFNSEIVKINIDVSGNFKHNWDKDHHRNDFLKYQYEIMCENQKDLSRTLNKISYYIKISTIFFGIIVGVFVLSSIMCSEKDNIDDNQIKWESNEGIHKNEKNTDINENPMKSSMQTFSFQEENKKND